MRERRESEVVRVCDFGAEGMRLRGETEFVRILVFLSSYLLPFVLLLFICPVLRALNLLRLAANCSLDNMSRQTTRVSRHLVFIHVYILKHFSTSPSAWPS